MENTVTRAYGFSWIRQQTDVIRNYNYKNRRSAEEEYTKLTEYSNRTYGKNSYLKVWYLLFSNLKCDLITTDVYTFLFYTEKCGDGKRCLGEKGT